MSTLPSSTRDRSGSSVSTPPLPSPNATHSSFIPSRYIKHASLINNCYPSRPEEKGPKSSELSYLIFYATSKPAKLTKVGIYIERKVARDYKKKRLADVHCSLEIIKALLLANKAHLNIFSKNIVSIIDTLLVDLSDLDVVRHCQNVFSCFCSVHDGSTLSVDNEFRTIYDRLVSRFAGIATYQGANANRYRMIGLRALEGVVASKALTACDHKAQLNLVLPPIVNVLIDSKDLLHSTSPTEPHSPVSVRRSVSIHVAVHPDNVVSDSDVTAEAIRCLHALFSSHNSGHVRLVLGLTISFLDEQNRWWPSTFGVAILNVVINAILPQYRYMVVNEIIVRIDSKDASPSSSSASQKLQRKVTLVTALGSILTSSLTLIGMPVLEVLSSLLNIQSKSLSSIQNTQGSLETTLLEGLTKSIGGLATHIYYTNQIPHIISHIVGKLSIKISEVPQPLTIEGVPNLQYRKALLRCLLAVIKTSKDNGRHEANFHGTDVSADLFAPCLGLLLDSHVEVRTGFAEALVAFLITEEPDADSDQPRVPLAPVSSDLYFRALAHQTLHAYARLATATPSDVVALYNVLRGLFTHFQDDEFLRAVPVLFSIQEWCLQPSQEGQEEGDHLIARKRAVATAIVQYFQNAAAHFDMSAPREYLNNIKTSRESESQWTVLDNIKVHWQVPSEPTNPVLTHPLARDHLVTLLTTVSDRFRSGADRFSVIYSPETQSSLLSTHHGREYGSGVFLPGGSYDTLGHKAEPSSESRIRVSRHLGDWTLPKFIPSSSSGNLTAASEDAAEVETTIKGSTGSLYNTKKIGVDTLKAALAVAAAQTVGADATSETGSSSAGSDTRGNSPVGQRFYPLSIHAQTLRKQQFSQHAAASSVSTTASTLAASRPDLADLLNAIQVSSSSAASSRLSMVVPPY
ncbi:plasma membrane localization protein [Podila clonocystis]|nr:plasma membrane localization protein [Podila clonocystis]